MSGAPIRPLLDKLGVDLVCVWLTVCDHLKPKVRGQQLIATRLAREAAHLKNTAEARRMCDDVMEHLGFDKARLGRVEFYVRQQPRETRRDEQPGSSAEARASERREGRFATSNEQLERLARLKREREERKRAGG